jgi:hypothetical protein
MDSYGYEGAHRLFEQIASMEETMSVLSYRLILATCALSWFLLGMHLPALHAMTSHGHPLHWSVLVLTAVIAVAGVWAFVALLRAYSPAIRPPRDGASAV